MDSFYPAKPIQVRATARHGALGGRGGCCHTMFCSTRPVDVEQGCLLNLQLGVCTVHVLSHRFHSSWYRLVHRVNRGVWEGYLYQKHTTVTASTTCQVAAAFSITGLLVPLVGVTFVSCKHFKLCACLHACARGMHGVLLRRLWTQGRASQSTWLSKTSGVDAGGKV